MKALVCYSLPHVPISQVQELDLQITTIYLEDGHLSSLLED